LPCELFQFEFKFIDQSDTKFWNSKVERQKSRNGRRKSIAMQKNTDKAPGLRKGDSQLQQRDSISLIPRSLLFDSSFGGSFKTGFDILTKSALSIYSIGHIKPLVFRDVNICTLRSSTSQALEQNPTMWTYMSLVPSRVGQSRALDDAAACLIQGAALLPNVGPSCVLRYCRLHYHTALQSIQSSLADFALAPSPETICAVMLLGIFEVLSQSIPLH
jgi:hypothetical protein